MRHRTLCRSALLALLLAPACGPEPCPEGSSRWADDLCHLDETEGGADDSGQPTGGDDTGGTGDTGGDDTGAPDANWRDVPAGCDPGTSPHQDPVYEVGSYFVQGDLFAEGTDIELDGDVAWTAGQGGVWSVDISDPENPRYLGKAEEGGGRWYHVLPGPDDALYVTNRERGMTVMNRSNPASPKVVGETASEGPAGMTMRDDRLYVANMLGSLETYDISDPLDPVPLDELGGLANAWAVKISGDHAYVADNTLGLVVVDLGDPDAPALVGSFETAGGAQDLDISADGSAVYVATGGAGVETFSLADPTAPESLGAIDVDNAVISVAVGGDTLWAVNHQDVVAFDIALPTSPVLVNTEQTEQFSMHVAADAERSWVADWGYITSFATVEGTAGPDASFSTGQVFLPGDGGSATLQLHNLGNAELELLGAEPSDERLSVQAESLTLDPGEAGGVRVSWDGGEALDATLCLATDDPDEPTVEITISGDQDGNPALGTDAPDFTLRDLEGRNYTLSHAIGRPVFIAFFATW